MRCSERGKGSQTTVLDHHDAAHARQAVLQQAAVGNK
jgi:hypothetical protein